MRKNNLKRKLQSGQSVFGTMITETTETTIVDLMERMGFDFFVIDMEHSRYDMPLVANILQYALRSPVTSVVRVPVLSYQNVAKVLDLGAESIWVPHVDTPEQARELVQYAKYPPVGVRGGCVPIFRGQDRDKFETTKAYVEACNEEVMLIAQMESAQACDNAAEIAATPGIDALTMGSLDLSLDMGLPGETGHPDVMAATQKVLDGCKAAGKPAGNHLPDMALTQEWMKRGMRFITYNTDSGLLIEAGQRALSTLKGVAVGGAAPEA